MYVGNRQRAVGYNSSAECVVVLFLRGISDKDGLIIALISSVRFFKQLDHLTIGHSIVSDRNWWV